MREHTEKHDKMKKILIAFFASLISLTAISDELQKSHSKFITILTLTHAKKQHDISGRFTEYDIIKTMQEQYCQPGNVVSSIIEKMCDKGIAYKGEGTSGVFYFHKQYADCHLIDIIKVYDLTIEYEDSNLTFTELPDGRIPERMDSEVKDTDKNLIKAALMGWHIRLSAGYNLGGTAPIPMPVEIRSIESFNPGLNLAIEGTVEKMFGKSNWGVRWGVRLETKGMTTDAGTKNYYMQVQNGDGTVSGYWTGKVKTKVKNTYLSIPALALYRINERWNVTGGAFASYMLDGEFSGAAHDGYLREGDPTGIKTELDNAHYDFSSDMLKFNWGLQAGFEYRAYKHLGVFANLQWSMNGIFLDGYSCVTFPLYPIYGTLGFTYLF